MLMMIPVTAGFLVVLVYEAVPMVRRAQWGELLVLCFLWLLGLSLAVSLVLGVEVANPSDAMVRVSEIFPGVRNYLLPGIRLFR